MEKLTTDVIQWIKDYFKDNSEGKVICGISGGKDSTIVAALCVEALGADRVIGVLMPNGEQADIEDSYKVCKLLGIDYIVINIREAYNSIAQRSDIPLLALQTVGQTVGAWASIKTNLPSRLRMATLYTVAACYPNSRVVNTSNLSERYIGYSTKFGDAAGDFSPLGELTVREVLAIGDDLGLPYDLVHKTPSDGMSGMSDEEKIGFTYDELDDYLLYNKATEDVKEKIERLRSANMHKWLATPRFEPEDYWDRKANY